MAEGAGGQFGDSTKKLLPHQEEIAPEIAEAATQLMANGFACVRQFLPQDELNQILAAMDAYEQLVLPQLPPNKAFFSDPDDLQSCRYFDFEATAEVMPEYDITLFKSLVRHPRFASLAQACLGEAVVDTGAHWAPSMFNKTAGKSGETPPHQDNGYFCLQPPSCVTVWVALDPVTRATGCLRYTPQSHLAGLESGDCLPHEASYNLGFSQRLTQESWDSLTTEEAVIDDLMPGDCVVHHSQTVHRAEENTSPIASGLRRRALGVVYLGTSAKVNAAKYAHHLQSMKDQGVIPGLKDSDNAKL